MKDFLVGQNRLPDYYKQLNNNWDRLENQKKQ